MENEHRTLIVIVTFLSTFFILVSTIPSGFLYTNSAYRQMIIPSYFEASEIQSYYNTTLLELDVDNDTYEFSLGDWNLKLHIDGESREMWMETYTKWWIFEWNINYFTWYNNEVDYSYESDGIEKISFTSIDQVYLSDPNATNSRKWTLVNSETTIVLYFGFNQTYEKPTDALYDGHLNALFCINFDKVNTSYNAWNLISALLFFQMPDVHPAINALIAIPIWVAIAYLIYILILKAIPFVGG